MDVLLALLLQVTVHHRELPHIEEIPQKIEKQIKEIRKQQQSKKIIKKVVVKKVQINKTVSKNVAINANKNIQCVQYARTTTGINIRGNANTWVPQAKKLGYTVDNVPKVGAVLSESHLSQHGHVSVVIASNNNTITVREANYIPGKITTRTIKLTGNEKFISKM